MLLLRHFLSEFDDILTQCSLHGVSICSSRMVDMGLMTSLMTSSSLGLNISETKPDSGMVPMDSLYESACGLSIGHVIDDVT